MKKSLPLILACWPYLFVLYAMLPEGLNEAIYQIVLNAYLVLTIPVYLFNIRNAFTDKGQEAALKCAFYAMVIKLVHIPFYLGVFFIGMIFIAAMVVPALLFASPIVVFMLFVVDGFLMLTSSMYGISAAFKAASAGMISKKSALLHSLFHCIFVADVISAILLYRKIKQNNGLPAKD